MDQLMKALLAYALDQAIYADAGARGTRSSRKLFSLCVQKTVGTLVALILLSCLASGEETHIIRQTIRSHTTRLEQADLTMFFAILDRNPDALPHKHYRSTPLFCRLTHSSVTVQYRAFATGSPDKSRASYFGPCVFIARIFRQSE